MLRVEKYTGEKTYMFASGRIATPEAVYAKCPAAKVFTHIVETDEARETILSILGLAHARTHYNISADLSEDEAIAAIQELRNAKPEYVPSAEERIAASLEFQNMMML